MSNPDATASDVNATSNKEPFNCIRTLSFRSRRLSAERKQTPRFVEIPRNWIGLKEALEGGTRLRSKRS